jgi:hypothetical protein
MTGDDHYNFTFTNSNTGVSTTKRFQQDGNTYTVGEFDPGVNYYVYVTPVINGLVTPSSATQTFLSSPASAPGILQGVTLTGSGSFAVIEFESVFPTSPFPNEIAVDTNFGDEQVLVSVSAGNKRLVIGPYTNGASYQFTLTPVTKSQEGILRYGTPVGIPVGNNYFIPGPPGTLNVNSIYASNTTVYINVSFDRVVHPNPDQFRLTSYTSRLDATVATITGVSGQINDLSMSYPAFTVSSGLISVLDYITLSAGVSSSNLVADITDNNGVWYSFRVSSISSGNVYTFANTNLVKGVVLNGSSFSVNFNTVTLAQFISSVTVSSSVASSSTVGGVTTSFDPSGQLFTISPVQTQEYTTFITEAFANRIFSTAVDSATLFAGPPAAPAYSAGPEVGNQTLRWTVGRASTGPRPIYYTFVTTDTSDVVTTQLTGTISGLTNGTFYLLSVYGFANSVAGPPTDPGGKISPRFVSPTSLSVTNISDTAVLFNIGRPLGGAYGYVITASSATRTASALFLDSGANNIVANFSTGLFADIYRFDVYTQSNSTLNVPNDLSASAPGLYSLGAPFQPTNVRGVYYGYQINGLTRVNLTLTASRGLVSGFGPLVAQYNISDNFGNVYTASALPPNGDLGYTFATLSAYLSYRFTITPFGNNTTGTPVTSSIFDFNPQPPASADLFMTGNNGGVMNISFGGPAFSLGQTIDYYSISAVSPLPLGFAFGIGTTPITRINVLESPLQQPAVGVFYQFKVFTTICGITSTGFALTPQVSGGPPIAPTVSYTVGCNTITFSISVNRLLSSVVIRNFFITEYYLNVSSGILLPTGTTYTVAVTPSLTPVATYTVSGVFTTSYSLLANTGTWVETPVTTPDFNIPNNVDNNTLALNTFPNIVLLTLSQGVSTLTFPVTSFSNASLTLSYATNLTTKPITTFNNAQPLQFTWRSGTGPFTGGSYRYDFLSLGNETLRSATATPVIVNLYVGSPGTPRLITNNTTVTVTFSAAVSTAVIPEYYVVSDNYGRTVSGATTLSSFVFTNTTTGSAYSYFVTSFAQGISSAPSQLSPIVYPGRPGPPSFEASFSVLTATLSTIVFPGSDTNPYIPITDVCLNIRGQSGYQVQKTNISSSYTGNGPTYRLTNLVPGESYTFSLSAFANQVYSTIEPTCNYYVGSIPPNIPNGATITLNNTTASVSVSAAIPKSKVGGGDPNTYVFIASLLNNTVFSTTSVPYNPATATYTGVLGGLVSLTDYRFSGHTITNGLSFGSSWSDTRIFNAGGPRPITGPTYMLPAGTPATSDVSLQVTISTGAVGITGLWADTSYFISVSTGVVSLGSSEFVVLTASSYTVTVSSGNIYYASVYAVKNQVTGTILPTPGFPVLPTPPRSPVITLEPTPDINILPTTTVPAKFDWTAALTADVFYFYSINSGTFVDNKNSVEAQSNLDYGGTYSLNVYSQINGISSGTVTSASAYAFTNPPTNLAYTRRSNIITMSWESAFQPAYPSNITYTVSVTTGGSSVSALSIGGGGGGPRVTIGSNIMPPTVYSQIANALTIFRPIVVTLSGSSVTGVRYNRSYTVTSIGGVIIQGGIGAYSFGGDGPGLPTFNGTTMAFSITNPSALPTNGYTIRDLLSGTIFASNIYSNSSVLTGTLGLSYNFTVQAFNSNLYSPGTSASTGVFRLATVGVSTLSATYFGNNVTLTWTTPRQHDNSIPTTTPPYTWTIFDQSGVMVRASTMPGNLPTTQQVSELNPALGGTYTYSIITNYHGISSDATVANRVSLSTTPTTSVTQTVIGAGIRVSWLTASQSVYLPATPNVLSSVVPSGGYLLRDLCENYSGTVPVVGTSTEFYISIPSAAFGTYKYYNFGVTAVHNGIPSSTTVPGGIFLGVNPVTNPTVSLNGMIATLTWTAASINGTTVPYEIYDRNGNQFGDPSARVFQTITCNTPGVYSFTSLITETIVATAFGAGGSVAAGGAASNTYSVLPGTTVVANVGAARPGSGGENTTVYVPNPVNPQLILDAGGGGGATVSGEGFFRNGGLPFPDGGPPGQPGYGSGGDAELGMGSPAGQNGKVSMTMTTQTFRSSIQTANTSISFLVQNRTSYNFQIVSYNTTLSATVSITPFNTAVFGPTSLLTTFTALQLRNTWNSPTNTPGSYLVTNMLTGTYDIVAPGTLTTSVFSELGVAGQSYRFSILALSNSIPSSQIYSLSISLLSTPPSNFNGDYNSTAITLTASGVPGTPLETFTLTDGSGNTLVANMTQSLLSATNARVNFPLLFGIPGRIYNYNLFGITNGLSSLPVPFTLGLTIPATTTLGQNPVLESPDKLTVYQCTPPADLFRAVSTNLSSTFYNNLPQSGWIGVAMETDGGTSIAINNNINGSNIYVTTNRGIGWGSVFTLGMVGVTACNVTIAGNGTWGAVATSGGVWVSSNVSTFSPWFYVSNTAGSNIISAGFSPNGSTLVVGQSGGFLYYISNSQLYPGNPSPVFTNGQNVSRAIWRAVTWSGEGNMVFAAPSDGNAVYSINGGESWTQFTPVGGYTTVSPNSNGTYVLLGQGGYPNAFQRSIANYTWTPVFPEEPRGLPPIGSLLYRCACSYEGNIQTAIVLGVATPSAYISYDFGQNWVSDGRFNPPFTGSAISSNGFIQVVVGTDTRIQSVINVPVSTGVITSIPIGLTAFSAFGNVPQGVTGYEVIPYRKNISGQSVFVWTVPQAAPTVFPQTSGPASFTTAPYASGFSATGDYIGYFVVNNRPSPGDIVTSVVSIATGSPSPVLSGPITTNPDVIVYSLTRSGGNLFPGVYSYKFTVQSGQGTITNITVPLKPPTGLALVLQPTTIRGTWTGTEPTPNYYRIYSNGIMRPTDATGTSATIPITAAGPIVFGVEAVLNGVISSRITETISVPPTPGVENFVIAGFGNNSGTARLTWTSNENTTYTIESSINFAGGGWGVEASGITGNSAIVTLYNFTKYRITPRSQNNILGPTSDARNVLRNDGDQSFSTGGTHNVAIDTPFIITGFTLKGAGGGGGAGYFYGGLGGGQGGTLTYSGSGPTLPGGTVLTLTIGSGGGGSASAAAGGSGKASGGGSASTISLNSTNIAIAGGGGGGYSYGGDGYGSGGGVGGGGGGGSGIGGDGGFYTGGFGGGARSTNSTYNLVGTFTVTNGQQGDTSYTGGASQGKKGGGAGGGAGVFALTPGNPATQPGCGGGGGGGGSGSDNILGGIGGAGADGSVSFRYVSLQFF